MPPKGKILTGVQSHFSAAHRDKETGQIHGHTWVVTMWFDNVAEVDARILKSQLEHDLARWDHKELPAELSWGEAVAQELAKRFMVVAVEVARPAEGIFARWEVA